MTTDNPQHETAQDARNIYQRIAEAMANVSYVTKDGNISVKTKSGGNITFNVVTHDAVTAKCRPALLQEGIVYHPTNLKHTQIGNRTEVTLDLRFVNIDNPTDFIDIPCIGYGVDNQDKGPGKAVSYAVKYGLLKGLGLETGDDADKEAIDHVTPAQAKAKEDADNYGKLVDATIADIGRIDDIDELGSYWKNLTGNFRDVALNGAVLKAKNNRKDTITKDAKEHDKDLAADSDFLKSGPDEGDQVGVTQ